MNARDAQTVASAVKLGIFTLVSLLVTGLLVVIMGNVGLGATRTLSAVFTSASMLQPGDDVRVAGLSVGEVEEVEIHDRTQALVRFSVAEDVPVSDTTRAEVRYLNIVGDRYLALVPGRAEGRALADDEVIPVRRTAPALNLTELYNGFQPLFAALDPAEVNELSMNIVQVLQGESGTVRGLLAETASLTNSLADREELIGQVIENLDTILSTVDGRREQLHQLVTGMEGWMRQLARDRDALGGSIEHMSTLTAQVADLLTRGRPLLKEDVGQLRRLVTTLRKAENKQVIVELLRRLPEALTDQTRIGTYGSWYQYYLCDFEGSIKLPRIPGVDLSGLQRDLNDVSFHSTAPRCQ